MLGGLDGGSLVNNVAHVKKFLNYTKQHEFWYLEVANRIPFDKHPIQFGVAKQK